MFLKKNDLLSNADDDTMQLHRLSVISYVKSKRNEMSRIIYRAVDKSTMTEKAVEQTGEKS